MDDIKQNYYGSLCTEMYEILHEKAPQDELGFFLSYAKREQKILEPLCGSGRFFVPFYKAGYNISGMDLSSEMLEKLKQKISGARIIQADLTEFVSADRYDYIFIPSGSLSLFTDIRVCKKILRKLKKLLMPGGQFVFAVETVAKGIHGLPDTSICAWGNGKLFAGSRVYQNHSLFLVRQENCYRQPK